MKKYLLASVAAVSYTHLDVYKRQDMSRSEALLACAVRAGFDGTALLDAAEGASVKLRYEETPVSYTHLDVYKRQEPGADGAPSLRCSRAVSYTHLDVYKRQNQRLSKGCASGVIAAEQGPAIALPCHRRACAGCECRARGLPLASG